MDKTSTPKRNLRQELEDLRKEVSGLRTTVNSIKKTYDEFPKIVSYFKTLEGHLYQRYTSSRWTWFFGGMLVIIAILVSIAIFFQ